SIRPTPGVGGRFGSPTGRRDRREYSCGAARQGGDHYDSDRLFDKRRPGRDETYRQPQPTGRQPYGRNRTGRGDWPKQLELLHEVIPAATTMAVLINPANPAIAEAQSSEMHAAARTLGLAAHVLHASTERDFDMVFATLVQLRVGALAIGSDPFFTSRTEQLAALALRHAVPAIFQFREFAAAGGLMSYATSI